MRTKIWFTLYQDIYKEEDWTITVDWLNPKDSEWYSEVLKNNQKELWVNSAKYAENKMKILC